MNDPIENQNITPAADPQNSAPQTSCTAPKRRRLWGKIPNLPTKVRQHINQSIRDDVPYTKILQDLAASGYTHINHDNLVHWNRTGFQDWLRDQEHFEKLVLTTDRACTQKTPFTKRKNFRTVSELDYAVLLHDAAREFNLEKIREQIAAKSDSFFRLVHANAIHERNAILRDRNEIELKKIGTRKKRATKPKTGGLNPTELAQIDRRMNL